MFRQNVDTHHLLRSLGGTKSSNTRSMASLLVSKAPLYTAGQSQILSFFIWEVICSLEILNMSLIISIAREARADGQ